jgi:hypothetical protein
MTYAGNFLRYRGTDCTILRDVAVNSKVSIKRSTKSSRDLGSREAYWEGLILADTLLQSGEILSIGSEKYLVQSTNIDPASGEQAFFAAKCNMILKHKRFVEDTDNNNNVIQEWQTINSDVPAYGEVVTYALRQFDPGLLDQTRYIIQVSKPIKALMLDRFVFDAKNYQVVSIDPVGMSGVVRLQLGIDTRP